MTPPAVTLWPKKSMEGAPKTHFSAFDDQTMMTKAEKDLPEVKTVLDVVFAGHLQIGLWFSRTLVKYNKKWCIDGILCLM